MTLHGLDTWLTTDPREGREDGCDCDEHGPCDECRAVTRCHASRDDEHASDEEEEEDDITW